MYYSVPARKSAPENYRRSARCALAGQMLSESYRRSGARRGRFRLPSIRSHYRCPGATPGAHARYLRRRGIYPRSTTGLEDFY